MIKRGIMRLDPVTHAIVGDTDGWQFEIGCLWLAKFSESWIAQYGSTWAVAWGRGETRYYTPTEKSYGH